MDVLAACQKFPASFLLLGMPVLATAGHGCNASLENGLQDLSFLEVPCTGAFIGNDTVASDICRAIGCKGCGT